MRTNHSWKDYFVFTEKERRVVISLLIIIFSLTVINVFYRPVSHPPVIENFDETIAKLSAQNPASQTKEDKDLFVNELKDNEDESRLFAFDPNTLDEAGFSKLGLRSKTIHIILNYRNKGGKFYSPDDLKKIYGLQPDEAERLLPYIKINPSQKEVGYSKTNAVWVKENNKPKPKQIDINSATLEQWKSLPAIGDVLSSRIVKYRDKIGGFSSIEQVKKTYGLSDSAYAVILPYLLLSQAKGNLGFKKININTASASELKANPAIPGDVADAIVIFRKQHGNYLAVEDIKKIVFMNEDLYLQVAPFLSVE